MHFDESEDERRIFCLVEIVHDSVAAAGLSKVLVVDQVVCGMVGDGCGGGATKG